LTRLAHTFTLYCKACYQGLLFFGNTTVELREALQRISGIRQQMTGSEVFRGYRSSTVGFSDVLGVDGCRVAIA
jgi:hypothetical protein